MLALVEAAVEMSECERELQRSASMQPAPALFARHPAGPFANGFPQKFNEAHFVLGEIPEQASEIHIPVALNELGCSHEFENVAPRLHAAFVLWPRRDHSRHVQRQNDKSQNAVWTGAIPAERAAYIRVELMQERYESLNIAAAIFRRAICFAPAFLPFYRIFCCPNLGVTLHVMHGLHGLTSTQRGRFVS